MATRPSSARRYGWPVQERRTRQTGTVVEVWHSDDLGVEDEAGPWVTICAEHSTSIHHATRKLAEWHASDPLGWCEDCREETTPAE